MSDLTCVEDDVLLPDPQECLVCTGVLSTDQGVGVVIPREVHSNFNPAIEWNGVSIDGEDVKAPFCSKEFFAMSHLVARVLDSLQTPHCSVSFFTTHKAVVAVWETLFNALGTTI
ncbi:hypothetical protein SKAU_G00209090 [Synaphobranchus kaupii]|uniref:Uncharacterized protein n=1 Tax=Synaphobranchus kaupii TaxID=118154 RepID=A0A9Q1ITV1_SYNKA|nr:hypothetical protein SKAU_G00209090 [Synaphobranchus kaupii]